MAFSTRRVAALAGCLLVLAPSMQALAQQPPADKPAAPTKEAIDEARSRHERGTQLYAEGDYKLALIEWTRAYELAPSYKVLYNIAQVNLQLGSYANALRAFEKYLTDGGPDIPAKRRAEVEKEISQLKLRTAHVQVNVNVAGAQVTVDGAAVGTTPMAQPLLVDAGQHTIAAKKDGHIPAEKTVTLAGTDSIQIDFDLPEQSKAVEPVPPVVRDRPLLVPTVNVQPKTSYLWVGWTATGTLAAGAIATGITAYVFSRQLQDELETQTTKDELDDQQSKARTLAIVTDVLGGAALLVGAATLYFTLTADDDPPASPSRSGKVSSTKWSVGVGPSSGHLRAQF